MAGIIEEKLVLWNVAKVIIQLVDPKTQLPYENSDIYEIDCANSIEIQADIKTPRIDRHENESIDRYGNVVTKVWAEANVEPVLYGYNITLRDLQLDTQLLSLLFNGRFYYDENHEPILMESNMHNKYNTRLRFKMQVYVSKHVGSAIDGYYLFTFNLCTGQPINWNFTDDDFFVPEYTIYAQQATGANLPIYDITDEDNLPTEPLPEPEKTPVPIVDTITDQNWQIITGEGIPYAQITMVFPDGVAREYTTVNNNGLWAINNTIQLYYLDVCVFYQLELNKLISDPVIVQVEEEEIEIEKSEIPLVYDIVQGNDYTITGKGIPDSEIILSYPSGEIATTIVDTWGDWEIINDNNELFADDEVITVQIEPNKLPSDEVITIVLPPVVVPKSEIPYMEQIYQWTYYLAKGTGVPGSDITVIYPDGSELYTQVESDGTWIIDWNTLRLYDGDLVVCIQIEPNRLPSDPYNVYVLGD